MFLLFFSSSVSNSPPSLNNLTTNFHLSFRTWAFFKAKKFIISKRLNLVFHIYFCSVQTDSFSSMNMIALSVPLVAALNSTACSIHKNAINSATHVFALIHSEMGRKWTDAASAGTPHQLRPCFTLDLLPFP